MALVRVVRGDDDGGGGALSMLLLVFAALLQLSSGRGELHVDVSVMSMLLLVADVAF